MFGEIESSRSDQPVGGTKCAQRERKRFFQPFRSLLAECRRQPGEIGGRARNRQPRLCALQVEQRYEPQDSTFVAVSVQGGVNVADQARQILAYVGVSALLLSSQDLVYPDAQHVSWHDVAAWGVEAYCHQRASYFCEL